MPGQPLHCRGATSHSGALDLRCWSLEPQLQHVPCLLVWGRGEEKRNTSLPAPEGVGCQTHCKITSLHLELCKTEPRRSAASHLLTRHEVPSLRGLWGGSPLLKERVGTCQT